VKALELRPYEEQMIVEQSNQNPDMRVIIIQCRDMRKMDSFKNTLHARDILTRMRTVSLLQDTEYDLYYYEVAHPDHLVDLRTPIGALAKSTLYMFPRRYFDEPNLPRKDTALFCNELQAECFPVRVRLLPEGPGQEAAPTSLTIDSYKLSYHLPCSWLERPFRWALGLHYQVTRELLFSEVYRFEPEPVRLLLYYLGPQGEACELELTGDGGCLSKITLKVEYIMYKVY
jgi:hypothetical protein